MKAATDALEATSTRVTISIHAAREGGDVILKIILLFIFISIHAAREGGDPPPGFSASWIRISIHAAREGGDFGLCDMEVFQV